MSYNDPDAVRFIDIESELTNEEWLLSGMSDAQIARCAENAAWKSVRALEDDDIYEAKRWGRMYRIITEYQVKRKDR